MELRYMKDIADDRGLDWEYSQRVLSSRDIDELMLAVAAGAVFSRDH
jgi:hypothetical protein